MNRVLLCICLALAFAFWRTSANTAPTPVVTPAVTPASDLVAIARQMESKERVAMAEAYQILARSVAGDPDAEPVFESTGSVRKAHRAALLAVWRGVLGNQPGKYEGLRERLEGAMEQRIGKDDVPLNPTLKQEAVRAFQEIAAAFSK